MTALHVVCTWIGRAWAVAALLLVGAVLCACASDARRKRRDVRTARRLARAMWLEQTAPADWQAVQDAVNRVHERNDEITDADIELWEIEAGWTA